MHFKKLKGNKKYQCNTLELKYVKKKRKTFKKLGHVTRKQVSIVRKPRTLKGVENY